ncbi:MAG: hypothetical protein U9R60_18205, partial [Bacteroidota bacterium]|nr:hypothetical protein [Bacteroidota bacterium]
MKTFVIFTFLLCIGTLSWSQQAIIPKHLINKAVKAEYEPAVSDVQNLNMPVNPASDEIKLSPTETNIGTTWYDLQSNSCLSNRISMHPDGTIGAVWTFGLQPTSFPDRGTGYNYYDGTTWGASPTARIESIRCGWPSYDTWGTNGEVNVAHNGNTGLQLSTRSTRGTGSWTESLIQGPASIVDDPTWPRLVCSGTDHDWIHLVYNSYNAYLGQTSAMLYSRSNDGGVTWNPENIVLSGTGSSFYNEIGADEYTMAANGSTVAILCGDAWYDLFVMKSTDNGATWNKTVIWNHPYPFFDWNTTITDTFFCVDNSASVAVGPDGKVHVAFGISRVLHDVVGTSYSFFYYTDGVGYWNEDMPAFSNHIHALAPPSMGYTNSELITDSTYIMWTQDINGNGTIDFLDVLSYRSLGVSTMPAITVDIANNVFVVCASTTEDYDNGTYNYKKLWARAAENDTWGGFVHLTDDIVHIFDESVYPVLSHTSDDDIHLIYQADVTPGVALDGDHAYQENQIIHSVVPKSDFNIFMNNFTVTTSANPPEGGTTTGDGSYPSGDSVTVVATSNTNWDFVDWTENSVVVSTDSAYKFELLANTSLVANFFQTNCVVTTSAVPPEGGTTTGDGTYPNGDSVTVSATSNPDYAFDYWMESDTIISTDTSFKFEVTGDRTMEAHFHSLSCTVSTSAYPIQAGTTSGDSTYPYMDSATITATANPGWEFDEWTENDTTVSTDPEYTFQVTDNRTFVAQFSEESYEVVTSPNPPEGGTTSGDGSYGYDDEVTIIASKNLGWEFEHWKEADTIVTTDTAYTFDIIKDRTFAAHFFQMICDITTAANPPEGGSTSGDGTFAYGDTVVVTATPNTSWDFSNWTENGSVVSNNASYSFTASYSVL